MQDGMFLSPNSMKVSGIGWAWLLSDRSGSRLLLSYYSIIHSSGAVALIIMVQDGGPSYLHFRKQDGESGRKVIAFPFKDIS